MNRTSFLIFLLFTFLSLTGFTNQPLDERSAQNGLPQSKDHMWEVLGETKVRFNHEAGTYSADIPASVKTLNGTDLKISGFILPLEAEEEFHHFLLSKRTPTCAFCPPGEPNEIVEVYTEEAQKWDDSLVTFSGKFELTENKDLGVFFKLTKARVVK